MHKRMNSVDDDENFRNAEEFSKRMEADKLAKKQKVSEKRKKLKERIKELEEMLTNLMKTRNVQVDGGDFMVFIEELREDLDREVNNITVRLDTCETNQVEMNFSIQHNNTRIDDLEDQIK